MIEWWQIVIIIYIILVLLSKFILEVSFFDALINAFVFLVGLIVIGGIILVAFYAIGSILDANKDASPDTEMINVVTELNPLINQCANQSIKEGAAIPVAGKAFVWDNVAKTNEIRAAQEYLPLDIQGNRNLILSKNSSSTLFIITRKTATKEGTYEGGTPGYQLTFDICVIRYPESESLGTYHLTGAMPPTYITVHGGTFWNSDVASAEGGKSDGNAVAGDIDMPMAAWISNQYNATKAQYG